MWIRGSSCSIGFLAQRAHQHSCLPQESPRHMKQQTGRTLCPRYVASMASEQYGDKLARCDVRIQEHKGKVLQNTKGEDEKVLQQPYLGQVGQSPILH